MPSDFRANFSRLNAAGFAFRVGYTMLLCGLLQEPHARLRTDDQPSD